MPAVPFSAMSSAAACRIRSRVARPFAVAGACVFAMTGASIRQRVFGEANGQRTVQGDPFLAPFFETAIEHVWGGVWNRRTAPETVRLVPSADRTLHQIRADGSMR